MLKRKYTWPIWIFVLTIFCVSCNINTPEVKQYKVNGDIKSAGLPLIIINSNHEVNHLEKIICEINIEDSSDLNQEPIVAKIKTRVGDFGDKNPKPSYSITLTRSISLLGMQADHEWILNGSYIDKSFLRDKLVYDLFAKMDTSIYTAKSEFVNLYINGEFKGLYSLTEKLNEKRLKINTNDRYAAIFKEPEIFTEGGRLYNQKYPDPGIEDRSEYLFEIKDFLFNSKDSDFHEKASQIFDLYNLANWQLLLQLTNNSQGLYSSFYLYRKSKNDKFKITVWDYDGSFGRNWDGSLQKEKVDAEENFLLMRLAKSDQYQNMLQSNWHNFRQNNTISIESLNNYIDANVQLINKSVVENVKKHPLNGPLYNDGNSFQQEIDLIKENILSGIYYLDSLYIFENEHPATELSD